MEPEAVNFSRHRPGNKAGHYESFFQRANHPSRPLAFWIRYTLFSPRGRPQDAIGELWAVYFDGERGRHVAAKTEVPFTDCRFSALAFDVAIAGAHLGPGRMMGSASSSGHEIAWELDFEGDEEPLLLLPEDLYEKRIPKAKALVGLPLATYRGKLTVDGETVEVDGWTGSQNHNWGSRHTDHYAWGQVAGFDSHPSSFLEVGSGQIKLGPLWTPLLTMLVLRHGDLEIALNDLRHALRAKAKFHYFRWDFETGTKDINIKGRITAPRSAFVGLEYRNPPGGTKHCLNSKLANCELRITRRDGRSEVLATEDRAAFEILTDDKKRHGVEILA